MTVLTGVQYTASQLLVNRGSLSKSFQLWNLGKEINLDTSKLHHPHRAPCSCALDAAGRPNRVCEPIYHRFFFRRYPQILLRKTSEIARDVYQLVIGGCNFEPLCLLSRQRNSG